MRRFRVVAICLLVSVWASCSSTSRPHERTTGNGERSSVSASGSPGDVGSSGAGAGRSSGRAASGSGASGAGTSGVGGGVAGGGSAPGGATGAVQGITATEIKIGFGTQKDADQAAAQFGLNAVFGDQERQSRAIADEINKHGGILGRKLKLVFHDDRTARDLANPDATATAQCADWTQDRPVFAGINIVASRNVNSFFACMAKARTPLLVSDLATHSQHQLSTNAPYLYFPGVATLERWAPTWIQRLNARGYFGGWNTTVGNAGTAPVKVGVPYEDSEDGRRYLKIVTKALADVGRTVAESFAFSPQADEALRQIPQMVLQFRTRDVTHVLLPASAYLITPVAERQNYRPRYGMTTLDGLSSLTVTTSPREQLRGTLAVGWLPVSDVDAAHDPGPVSSNQTRCRKTLEAAGISTSDRLTFTTQLIVCDLFYFLEAALKRAGAATPAALQQGAAALGDTFPPAFTFVERYGPNRYDGAAAVRDVRFDEGCGCFVFFDRINRPLPA
jgi:substrate-binding family protein